LKYSSTYSSEHATVAIKRLWSRKGNSMTVKGNSMTVKR